jgi:hypothetical protein
MLQGILCTDRWNGGFPWHGDLSFRALFSFDSSPLMDFFIKLIKTKNLSEIAL